MYAVAAQMYQQWGTYMLMEYFLPRFVKASAGMLVTSLSEKTLSKGIGFPCYFLNLNHAIVMNFSFIYSK
jgi:hypothetical protein